MESSTSTSPLTETDTIWIVTEDTPSMIPSEGWKGSTVSYPTWSDEVQQDAPTHKISTSKGVPVSAQHLEAEMSRFLAMVGRLFHRAERQAASHSGLQLEEVELAVEITAEGQVRLIGNGAKAGGKGAITLKFKRSNGQAGLQH